MPLVQASSDGRGFAASGGVANAVAHAIRELDPEREIKVASAEGLADCKKLMRDATRGKYDGYLIEGMACPGGCIGGAGTLQSVMKSTRSLKTSQKEAKFSESIESNFTNLIEDLENFNEDVVDD
jgi:iron only hydrogenase large subunit-like protein